MNALLEEIRGCRVCAACLAHEPRPVVQAAPNARLLIIGQAPGARVHATGIPWNDPSGDTLRAWLSLTSAEFYDANRVAIVPMGFCYPGKGKSGDLPPRPECAPLWHARLLAMLPQVKLTLLIGSYAQHYYLQPPRTIVAKPTLTETVAHYADYLPTYFPLPHPSPRNRFWLAQNPWFASEVLPVLRQQIY